MRHFTWFLLITCLICGCQSDEALAPEINLYKLMPAAFDELIELCDTASLQSYEEFEIRLNRIQQIFADHGDERGAFPTVYKAITTAAIQTMHEGYYEDLEYSTRFVMDFSKRYMYILEDHLYGRPLEFHWQVYYDQSLSGANITRLVLEGINAHLTLDLTRSLAETGVYPEFIDDWILYGDNTVQSVPGFLEELQEEYDTDASDVFGVFFVGDIIDALFGEGAAVNFGFNLLRLDAFDNALLLQDSEKAIFVERKLKRQFFEREAIIDMVDRMDLTPRMTDTRPLPQEL